MLTPDRDQLPDQDKKWNVDIINLVQWWEDHLTNADIEWLRSFHNHLIWNEAYLVHDSPMDRLMPESWHKPNIALKHQEWFYHSRGLSPKTPEEEWKNSGL